jgi:hypothetical protein
MKLVPALFIVGVFATVIGMSANASDTVVRCGQVSDVTPASFVITSPGTDPLRVVVPDGKRMSKSSGYACVSVVPGRPGAHLADVLAPGTPGYVAEH